MTLAPAAGVSIDRAGATGRLGTRLASLVAHSDPEGYRVALERLLPTPSGVQDPPLEPEDGFSWLVLPRLLAARFGVDPRVVEDLSWLQYCVYAVFRIQDDLIDGDSDDPTLAVWTNHLFARAAATAALHFDGASSFWTVFEDSIDATSRAILRLKRLHRTTQRDGEEELALYAGLSASLKIASAGVLIVSGNQDLWFSRLSPALNDFAVAAQIVDDIRDIREDLDRGAINHAAWFLSAPVVGSTPEAIEAVIASNLATTDRLDLLLARADQRMSRSLERFGRDSCAEVFDYLDEYRKSLGGLAERICRSRSVLFAYSSTQKR